MRQLRRAMYKLPRRSCSHASECKLYLSSMNTVPVARSFYLNLVKI